MESMEGFEAGRGSLLRFRGACFEAREWTEGTGEKWLVRKGEM